MLFSSFSLVCGIFGEMNESLSIGETSSAPRKRRRKYCAAFECNNSAYDVNGIHTIIISSSSPRTLSEEINGVHLSSGDTDRMTLLFPLPVSSVMSIFQQKYLKKTFWSLEFEDRLVIVSSFCCAFVMLTRKQCCVHS